MKNRYKRLLGYYYRALETEKFVYYVNYQEGDDNANVHMYNRETSELISNNYFASNDLFEVLESGEYTWISRHMKYNWKLHLEATEKEIQKKFGRFKLITYLCPMEKTLIETRIETAINFVNEKNNKGLLVWNEIPEYDDEQKMKDWWVTPNGDRETLYSIATLFSDESITGFSKNELRDILEDHLCEKFPNKC